MRRLFKAIGLSCIFLLAFSLIACGSTDTAKDKKEVNGTETAKVEEITKDLEHKPDEQKLDEQKPEQEKLESAAADEEKVSEQKAATGNETKQPQTSQAHANQSAPANNKPATSTSAPSKSTTPATAPEAPSSSPPADSGNRGDTKKENEKPATTVTFSIVGPDKHVILAATKVPIKDGDTVFDVLKQSGVQYEKTGSGATTYIQGIEDYYEFDYGPTSGWVFKQNGASLTKSVGITKVKDGDRIECFYTEK